MACGNGNPHSGAVGISVPEYKNAEGRIRMTTNNPALAGGNHDAPAALAEWLNPISWQAFGTFEFPWRARPETAGLKFDEIIDRLERGMRTRVCFVRAAETKSKSGAPVPLHLHAALTATKHISCELVTDLWNSSVGRTDGDLALVEPYNPALGGIAYIAKQINDHGCEWDCRNVHLFNRNIQVEQKTDHASIRSARRWQAQNVVSGNQPGVFLRAA